jgi:branched-chain amino acid transport system ATP-binding protein
MLLEVEDIEVRYGSVPAVRNVSFHVAEGEIVCFIGANGAGKSTTMLALAGVLQPARGDIRVESRSIVGLAPEDITRLGIALVPEGRRIFGSLTVHENLLVASGLRGGIATQRSTLDLIFELFPILHQRSDSRAGNLSGGEQQQLAIARALLTRPRLLVVDEPSLGLAPKFIELVYQMFAELRANGMTLLLVEQSMRRALSSADRAYLLQSGSVVLHGKASELAARNDLEHIYFGEVTTP